MSNLVKKLILGTVQLGLEYGVNNQTGKPNKEAAFRILKIAHRKGIKIIDTADAYGNVNEIIGEFNKLNPSIHFDIITKFKIIEKFDYSYFLSTFVKLLETLNVKYIHCYMFHDFSNVMSSSEVFVALKELKSNQKIGNVGVSVYDNVEFEKAIENQEIDIIQLPYNLLDNDCQRLELLRLAKRNGKQIHTRSVFLQGLFFKEIDTFSGKLSSLVPYCSMLNDVAVSNGISISRLAMGYALTNKYIDNVLFGVETEEQLIDNVDSNAIEIDLSVRNEVNKIRVKEIELLNPSNWK